MASIKQVQSRVLCAVIAMLGLSSTATLAADPGTLTVKVDQPGAEINPLFYGLMTEEINYSYDGGLYAELLRNRIFKEGAIGGGRGRGRGAPADPNAPAPPLPAAPASIAHWAAIHQGDAKASLSIDNTDPINTTALDTALKVALTGVSNDQRAGVANDGYWGIPVKPNTKYNASFYAKAQGLSGPLTVTIESTDGKTVYASGMVPSLTDKWQKYNVILATGPDVKRFSGFLNTPAPEGGAGRGGQATGAVQTQFVISAKSRGTLWLNLVSLMPPTFNNRPNGNRSDIMQLMADMKPAFLRFPGGNYVEGNSFPNRFDFRRTLGPMEERPGHQGTWQYRVSDGMGLLEYLYWCEDIKMEPVLAVFAGHILGNGPNGAVVGDALKPYIQEAMDEIEYVTGDKSTKWGAFRARDGHPEPFKLTYVEIGNEDNLSNGLSSYEERFTTFYDAIKAKYPAMQIISTVPSGQRNYLRTSKPDVIDDHYYMNFMQAIQTSRHYDNYDRSGPKIFIGEWATRIGAPTSNFNGALGDAVFLTGCERNADLIIMTCYAPLFVNVNPPYPQYEGGPNYPGGTQWPTDLIGYDGLTSFGSAGYYVEKMFYNNRGDVVLPVAVAPTATIFSSASLDKSTGDIILKVVNIATAAQSLELTFQGAVAIGKNAEGEILTAALNDMNSISEPQKVVPRKIIINDAAPQFVHEFPPSSITVLHFKTK